MSKQVVLYQDNAAGSMNGTIFRKQIVRFGNWVDPFDPQSVMTLDEAWAKKIVKNFTAKVIDRVPVPLNHTDDVSANTGELIKLEIAKDGLYGYLDIRDPKTVQDIENGLVFDNSISFDWEYRDTETGKNWGPVLLHVALVNNPYLVHMKPFEKIEEAISNFAGQVMEGLGLAKDNSRGAIMLSESKVKELRDMSVKLSKITNDKEFPVTISVTGDDGVAVDKELAAGEEVEIPEDQLEAVKKQIEEAADPNAEDESSDDGAGDDEAGDENADNDESQDEDDEADKKELSRLRAQNAEYKAKELYNTLLSAGKITPSQEAKFMELAKSENGATVTLSKGKKISLSQAVADVLMAGPQVVNFSENGSDEDGDDEENDAAKKPSEKLSDAESKGLQAVGADKKRLDELAEKYPAMASQLEEIDSNKGDK